jgi:hypothetical protein
MKSYTCVSLFVIVRAAVTCQLFKTAFQLAGPYLSVHLSRGQAGEQLEAKPRLLFTQVKLSERFIEFIE